MAYDTSLFDYDPGYYEFIPNNWLPGKIVSGSTSAWTQQAIDAAVNLDLKDKDVIIATYPKTGQTWTMAMINFILQAKELEEGKTIKMTDMFKNIPFIESEELDGKLGADIFKTLPSPRFMKTHLPYELWKDQLKKYPHVRVIQNIRNPKDTLVSYYHHFRSSGQLGAFHGTWDQYFEIFKEKRLPWGDYFEHNANWYKFNRDRKESLVLVYEDMKKSQRDHVIKIADFLGYGLSDKVIDLILEKSSFKDMYKNINDVINKETPIWKSDRSQFVRKGQVGDWVNYFSEEQSDFVDVKYKEHLKPLGLNFEYENVDI